MRISDIWKFRHMPEEERVKKLISVAELKPQLISRFTKGWEGWFLLKAREAQIIPEGDWSTWVINAGRGFGKTRTGAETVNYMAMTGQAKRIALIGRSAADIRDVIVEGESGILACAHEKDMPQYKASLRRLVWPNGSVATTFSAEEPGSLRGPQHDFAWCDEFAAWSNPEDVWSNLGFGLRLGKKPRAIITTTPRPIPLLKKLIASPSSVVSRGSTLENRANLAPDFTDKVLAEYGNSRIGKQEIFGEVLEDTDGALWNDADIDLAHGVFAMRDCAISHVIVAVDPCVTNAYESDECGIVVVGRGDDGRAYILADRTMSGKPAEWANEAIKAFKEFGASYILAESNQGGELVKSVLKQVDTYVPVQLIFSSEGKAHRAEPVSAAFQTGKVGMNPNLTALSKQMRSWIPYTNMKSPDRLDAMVHGVTELIINRDIELPYTQFMEFQRGRRL